jgi:hypothetical protein
MQIFPFKTMLQSHRNRKILDKGINFVTVFPSFANNHLYALLNSELLVIFETVFISTSKSLNFSDLY